MPRYFIELAYKGTAYSGFQIQQNAITIQSELEKAFQVISGMPIELTGSSRTDAGVHALQNFFHCDLAVEVEEWRGIQNPGNLVYKLNAILPEDISILSITKMHSDAHCRFDAISRTYQYYIYKFKHPFLTERAYYFPYTLDVDLLQSTAEMIKEYNDFSAFSKRNTQVKTFNCDIMESYWISNGEQLIYHVKANRFLRGMVRALVATQLKVGRKKIGIETFREIIENKDSAKAFFAAPAKGLFLEAVHFREGYFENYAL